MGMLFLALGFMALFSPGDGREPPAPEALGGYDIPFLDEFDRAMPLWNWGKTQGRGFHSLDRRASRARIGIAGPAAAREESDCSLEEARPSRKLGRVDFRLRCQREDGGDFNGTLGWGVWRPGPPDALDAAWFLYCSRGSDPAVRGFSAMVVENGRPVFSKPLDVDFTAWHEYGVEVAPGGVTFHVDGVPVARTPRLPGNAPRAVVLWMDNKRILQQKGRWIAGWENVPSGQYMNMDRVEYRSAKKARP